MKFLSLIISFFVLMNVIAPMPTHDCASHATEQNEKLEKNENKNCCNSETEKSHNHQSHQHHSSANCNCGCNAVISIIPAKNIISVAYSYFTKDNFIYIENNSKNTFNTIWHPPKV